MRHTLCCNIILFSIFIILTLGNFNIVKSFIPIKKIYGLVNHIDDINKSHQGPYPDGIYLPIALVSIFFGWGISGVGFVVC